MLFRSVSQSRYAPSVHIVKIDVEGAEWQSFETLSNKSYEKITYIIGEYHAMTSDRPYDKFFAMTKGRVKDISKEFDLIPNSHLCEFVWKVR